MLFWVGGLPTSAITDFASSFGSSIKIINTTDYIDDLNKRFGDLYRSDIIPANSYKGLVEDVKTISLWNVLLVRAIWTRILPIKLLKQFSKT